MKRAIVQSKLRNLAVMAASVLALAACGGGGGGGDRAAEPLASGTFTRFVPANTTANYTGLLSAGNAYARWQYLYLPGAMLSAGKITGIAVQYFNAVPAAVSCPNMTVKMSHSNLTSPTGLSATFASNVQTGQGSQVTVLNNATVNYPAGAVGDFYTISLTTPFEYNGFDSLLIEFEMTAACTNTVFDRAVTGTGYPSAVFTFTNGSATGLQSDFLNNFRFVFTGGDNTLVPSVGSVNSNIWPFNNNAVAGRKVQMLYTAAEINGSGPLTGIGFPLELASTAQEYTITVQLGHSTLNDLTTTFASNFSGVPVTVASGVIFKVPAGVPAGGHVWIPVPAGVFTYNGTDNLVMQIEVTDNSAATGTVPWRINTGFSRNVKLGGDLGAATGTVINYYHYVTFRFHGGAVAVITNGNTSTAFAFSTAANGRLSLYRASELGSAGSITSVACRMLDATSTATSYANYQVIIGHSNVSSLSATSSDNFVSQMTAVNGTVSVPAGLVAGDWIEVPLSTPFTYDGKSNLAIWMGTTAASGAAANHTCLASLDAVRHPGQIAFGSPGAPAVGVQDAKFDMRLRLSR